MSRFIAKDGSINNLLLAIKQRKERIKAFQDEIDKFTQELYNIVSEHEQILTEDGEELATWKYSKDTEYFDSKALKENNSDIYKQFIKVRPGARVLRIK